MLSVSQLEAVHHSLGPCLVLAGPGSGKTTVLTQRIRYLIQEKGVAPGEILVITFTRAAALEMKERFDSMMSQSAPVCFGTFHSIFFQMLKKEKRFASYELLTGKRKHALLKEVAGAAKVEMAGEDEYHILEKELSFLKNKMMFPKDYEKDSAFGEDISKLYEHYEARKATYSYMDFDDMLSLTLATLRWDKSFLEKWQERFRYIMIDEIQDMNALQFEVIRLLALPDNNLFVVGDDDQSIYGFRGAEPKIMLDFPKTYPVCKQILLENNYRSQEEIVEKAKRVIGHNKERFFKDIVAKSDRTGSIVTQSFGSEEEQAKGVVAWLQGCHQKGKDYEELAVLFRNHNLCQELVRCLREEEIPFHVKERLPNPYEHEVVLDLVAYLRLCGEVLHRQDLFRVMNKPNRYLSRASVEREWVTFDSWKSYYKDQSWLYDRIELLQRDVSFMKKLSGSGALIYIRKKLGYDDYLRQRAKNDAERECLFQAAEVMNVLAQDTSSPSALLKKWEEAKKLIEQVNQNLNKGKQEGVGLYTLHSSKGLEFDGVCILSCNEGILPNKQAETDVSLEEERRLFYVGMTRAKEDLFLCSLEAYQDKKISPSRFLREMQGTND